MLLCYTALSSLHLVHIVVVNVIILDELSEFPFPPSLLLVTFDPFTMSIRRVSHWLCIVSSTCTTGVSTATYLNSLISQFCAKRQSIIERSLWLLSLVDVPLDFTDHASSGRIDGSVDDVILDCLGHDIFGVLFRLQMKLNADIPEWDARVRQGDGTQSSLDDEMAETEDEEVGIVGLESGLVRGEGLLEGRHVSDANSYGMSI
jgi:hypothetical protein